MSRHEGVSCDSCMKANFRGRRYKCLVCYDYDLCSTCYEAGATTTRHTVDHAMQCILTRSDYDLYYGGEAVSAEQPQSFVCPYCGKMGYTDATLQEHVSVDHPDSPAEVVCPICAALPGGDPNHVTDDFATHLQLEHRAPRDFEDQMGIRHVRRIPQTALRGRTRRSTNMQFHSTSGGSASLAGLAPSSGREAMDPIAELLSQLSTVRSRAAAAQSVSSQLQQLEQQLHNTRYQQPTRQQLERLPRRAIENSKGSSTQSAGQTTQQQTLMDYAGSVISTAVHVKSNNADSNFLLSKVGDPDLTEIEKQNIEAERADRSIFVQELLLSSMTENLRLSDDSLSNASLSDTDEHSLNFKNNEGNGSIGKELEDEPPSKRPAKQQDQTSEGGGGGGGSGSTTAANRDKSSTSSLPSSAQSLAGNVEKSRRERSAVNSNVNSNCVSEGCAGEVTASSTSSSSCLATKEKVLSKGKREGASNGSGLEKGPTKVQH